MRHSKEQLARKADRLGELRRRIQLLQTKAEDITSVLLRTGGAEGRRFVAELVKMPRRVMTVRAHVQVRTRERVQ